MKHQVRTLRDEVTRLQNGQDRLEERLAAMEMSGGAQVHAAATSAPAQADGDEHPPLAVVRLEPGTAATEASTGDMVAGDTAAAPDDSAPRPVIRAQGAGAKRPFEGVRPAQPEGDAP